MKMLLNIRCYNKNFREGGLYIVLGAGIIVVLLTLASLIFGIGIAMSNRGKLRNIAGLAALSTVDRYLELATPCANGQDPNTCCPPQPPGNNPTIDCRIEKSVSHINQFLSQHKLPLDSQPLGNVSLEGGDGGKVVFGNYYPYDPDGMDVGLNPCNGNYPCFRPKQAGETLANTVRLTIKSTLSDIPFGNFINFDSLSFSEVATASTAPRCTVGIIDLSLSVTKDSHPSAAPLVPLAEPNPNFPILEPERPYRITYPPNPALFAIPQNIIADVNCADPSTYPRPNKLFQDVYWCNLTPERRAAYQPYQTPYGTILIDTAGAPNAPLPLANYFMAINSAFREIASATAPGDRFSLIAFRGDIDPQLAHIPPITQAQLSPPANALPGSDLSRTDTNIGWAIRVTNLQNAFNNIPPNAFSQGFVPLITSDITASTSNIIRALDVARNDLNLGCQPDSRKSIIIATDGIGNCNGTPDPDILPVHPFGCGITFIDYNNHMERLTQQTQPSLKNNQIAVTVISDGNYITNGFYNRKKPNSNDFYTAEEAALVTGLTFFPSNVNVPVSCQSIQPLPNFCNPITPGLACQQPYSQPVGGCSSPCPDCCDPNTYMTCVSQTWPRRKFNYYYAGIIPGVKFDDGIFGLNRLAIDTGGIACQLQPLCPANQYDVSGNIIPTFRINNQLQACALQNLTKPQQAARCGKQTVGNNPTLLVRSDV